MVVKRIGQKKLGVLLIRILAFFIIVRGFWILVSDFRSIVFTFRLFPDRVEQWGISVFVLIALNVFIVPLLYIIGGLGMLMVHRWARILIFCGLWLSVLLKLTNIVCQWYIQMFLNMKTFIVRQGFDPVLQFAISSHVLALVEVAIIIFLMRPYVREQFKH